MFNTKADITDQWLNYLEQEAQNLADHNSALGIENYMDNEVLNPQMQELLESDDALDVEVLDNEMQEPLMLNAVAVNLAIRWPKWLRFRKLKRKIRRVFCSIVHELEGLSWKDILKKLLVALIPAFAGGGVPGAILPLVVAFVALAIKKGFSAVCPV